MKSGFLEGLTNRRQELKKSFCPFNSSGTSMRRRTEMMLSMGRAQTLNPTHRHADPQKTDVIALVLGARAGLPP